MKKIFSNTTLIVIALEDGEPYMVPERGEPAHFLAKLNRCIGATKYRGILDKVSVAHEIWVYRPNMKMFTAYKNKGIGNEITAFMKNSGINLKVVSAKISDATAQTLRFDTDKDLFHFNLKYL
jgi:hypothetical protein